MSRSCAILLNLYGTHDSSAAEQWTLQFWIHPRFNSCFAPWHFPVAGISIEFVAAHARGQTQCGQSNAFVAQKNKEYAKLWIPEASSKH